MLKLVLIAPPSPNRDIPDREGLPLGLCMLAGMVRDRADISIVDAYSRALSVAQTAEEALALEPDIVGISLPFAFSQVPALEIARRLKSSRPGLAVIAGGPQATFRPGVLLSSGLFDAVAVGEAEETIADIIRALESAEISALREKPPPGLLLRGCDGEPVGGPRPLVDPLDDLPFAAYDCLPGFPLQYSARILTSRGCSRRCPYCSSGVFWRSRYRTHSVERILTEISVLRDRWGIRRVSFADDNFNLDRRRARELAHALVEADLQVEWGASVCPETLSEEDLRLFARAGMTGLFLGIESASPRVLSAIGRGHDPAETAGYVRLAENLGVRVHASFMIGLPDETPEDVEATISYARSLPASSVGFHIFHPLPGSEYGENPEKYGIAWAMPEGEEYRLGAIDTYAPIRTRYLSTLQIVDYYHQARAVAREKSSR